MNAIEVIENLSNTNLIRLNNLRYCLVNKDKIPFTVNGVNARPNVDEDFSSIEEVLEAKNLQDYAGLGISIKASNIYAVDVDHCFHTAFDINSIDKRGLDIINIFKDFAYIEFSFSGTGLRIFYQCEPIEDYNDKYYIKNSNNNVEYYQPSGRARYVTVTGRAIIDNEIALKNGAKSITIGFLDKFMLRPQRTKIAPKNVAVETVPLEELQKKMKSHIFNNMSFQNAVCDGFKKKRGLFPSESEQDWYIIYYIYSNITQNKDQVKALFESTWFFKEKDNRHKDKWYYDNFRYFEYVWGQITK